MMLSLNILKALYVFGAIEVCIRKLLIAELGLVLTRHRESYTLHLPPSQSR